MMVNTLAVSLSSTNAATISLVKPNEIRLHATIKDPMTIIGRLLPHFDVDSSAKTPMMGCTIKPDNGPATQTSDVCPLDKPSERRYGVQSIPKKVSISILTVVRNKKREQRKIPLTSHLDAPGEAVNIPPEISDLHPPRLDVVCERT